MSDGFVPSDAQRAAIARMEAMLAIRNGKSQWNDVRTFDDYWKTLQAACDRKRSQLNRDDSIELQQKRERKRERKAKRIAAYYRDEEHLFQYGLTYAYRYQPAVKKLAQQLARKCDDASVVATVMKRLQAHVNEADRVAVLVDHYRAKGKNERDIATALRRRLFPDALVQQQLRLLRETHGSSLDVDVMRQRIHSLQKKGLSRQAIMQKLSGSAADRDLLQGLFDEQEESGDFANAQDLFRRLRAKGLDDRTITRRLVSRGFAYGDVKRLLQAED